MLDRLGAGNRMGQYGFGDEEERLRKPGRKKPTLERLSATIPWEKFRPLLESAFRKERKSPGGDRRNHHVQDVSVTAVIQIER